MKLKVLKSMNDNWKKQVSIIPLPIKFIKSKILNENKP